MSGSGNNRFVAYVACGASVFGYSVYRTGAFGNYRCLPAVTERLNEGALNLLSAAETERVAYLCTCRKNLVSVFKIVSEMLTDLLGAYGGYGVVGEVVCGKGYVAFAVLLAVNSRYSLDRPRLDVPYYDVVWVLVFSERVGELYGCVTAKVINVSVIYGEVVDLIVSKKRFILRRKAGIVYCVFSFGAL